MTAVPHLLKKIFSFGIVSGVGLGIDFLVFISLLAAGVPPLAANLVSGTCAITFVYFASVKRIFSYHGSFLLGLFLTYLLYQSVGVTAASFAVDALVAQGISPPLAKIFILPITFSANYLFMSWLTRNRESRSSRAS